MVKLFRALLIAGSLLASGAAYAQSQVPSGTVQSNCSAASGLMKGYLLTDCLDRVFGSTVDRVVYRGSGGWVATALSAYGRTLIDDADAATARATLGVVIGTNVQAWDADLAALAANSTAGFWAYTGAGTGAARTLTAPAAGLTITNPAGTAGNPTFALANDLAALEGLSSTGIARRTGTDTWTVGTAIANSELATMAANTTKCNATAGSAVPADCTASTMRTNIGAAIGANVQAWDADLDAFALKTAPTGAVVGTTDTQTLSGKTLTAPVINSPTGIVKGDVGLGNVDNTSDVNKPVSTAQNTAIVARLLTVKVQKFTASGTYTRSTGMAYAVIECIGAGGGGGGARGAAGGTSDAGGGGGGGAYSRLLATSATIGASQTVTLGTGGAGGVSNVAGSGGGTTSVGSLCTAGGGGGGSFGSVSFGGSGAGGTGGAAGTGDISASGTPGQEGIYFGGGALLRAGGFGGPSVFGGAGIGGASGGPATNGAAGTVGGGGGGAYGSNGAGAANGGIGGPGYVIITEYCTQ